MLVNVVQPTLARSGTRNIAQTLKSDAERGARVIIGVRSACDAIAKNGDPYS
jgi:hypothetical protein